MTIRILNWLGTGALAMSTACGSGVVDVGDVAGAGGTDALGGDGPDAESPYLSAGCTIANLNQYRIVFDSDDGRLERRIYSMRADGSSLEPLTPVDELAREPALSPDGRQLAYVTPDRINLQDLDTGESELLAPNADRPSWSPNGEQLIYRGNFGFEMTVLDMSQRTYDLQVGCSACAGLELTPDGTNLVYGESTGEVGIETPSTIYSMTWATGATQTLVPRSPFLLAHPTVSPDGIWVASSYRCSGDDGTSLWVSPMTVITPACEGRRITHTDVPSVTHPKWGPGVLIAYERGEPPRDIAIVAADTGEECIIQRPGDDRNPSWGAFAVSVPD